MSSLAFYGSPIDDDNNNLINRNNNRSNDNVINKKRNKTQKNPNSFTNASNKEPFYSDKVNQILNSINNLPSDGGDDENENNNYKPLPPPNSVGVQKTIDNERVYLEQQEIQQQDSSNTNNNYAQYYPTNIQVPKLSNIKSPLLDNNDDWNNGISNYSNYYKPNKYLYNPNGEDENSNSVLMNKLNYMIQLLEEQKDEKTDGVIEEVVLYCFLGIFIIFLVDSFNHLGKYKR
jgi:hypothetical protein